MTYASSSHDQPWFSDPDYDNLGRIRRCMHGVRVDEDCDECQLEEEAEEAAEREEEGPEEE
jgi:hypothetical protein